MRKKVNDKDVLKYDIKLRVNQQHYDRLCHLLAKSHYKNMSELLRDIVCEQRVIIYTRDESLGVVMEELSRIRREINAVGINANQAVKQINKTADKNKIILYGLELSEDLCKVDSQIQQLFPIISKLSKKWLQG